MPLGTMELFETMLAAAAAQDLATLEQRRDEFLKDEENYSQCRDRNGDTLLHKALASHPRTVLFVLDELNGKINAKNALGKTALHEAAKRNLVSNVKLLIEKGADVLALNEVGSTPFHTACACGAVEVLELLLEQEGVTPDLVDSTGSYPLHKCAYDGNDRVFDALLKHGASIDARDGQECTAFHIAVKMNRVQFVEKFLDVAAERGFDINTGDKAGNTLLHYAVVRCLHGMVKLLLRRGADINKANEDGNTPLHLAAQNFMADSQEWEDLIIDLLRMGADHNATNDLPGRLNGRRPVDYVSRNVAYLFDPREFKRRDAIAAEKEEKEGKEKAELEEEKKKYKEEIRRTHKEREHVRKEVIEQRRKDEEERQREEEVRLRKEEEERAKELEEQEAKKKKAKSKKKDG